MKRNNGWLITLSLLLVLSFAFSLVGCPAPGTNNGATTTPPTEENPGGEPNTPPAETPTNYENPTAISGTGDAIPAGAAVISPITYDAGAATLKTVTELRAVFRSQSIAEGQLLSLTGEEPYVFEMNDRAYDANGMLLIAPAGIEIRASERLTLKNLTIIGSLSVIGSKDTRLENVRILSDATALSLDSSSSATVIDSRIEGKIAIDSRADGLYLLSSYIGFTETGLADAAPTLGAYVMGCRFAGTGTAIALATDNAEIRRNTITVGKEDTAVAIGECENLLFAENIVCDAQNGVILTGSYNASLVRNSLISVTVQNTEHVSLGDNMLGGRLYAYDNGYLLANGNTYPTDEYDHTPVLSGNISQMGDTVNDVNERLSAGANEKLLPQVDRDRFTYMARKDYVRSPEGDARISNYIQDMAKDNGIVIVAPGAYRACSAITLAEAHKDTTIYAYGVFAERVAEGATDNNGAAVYYGIYNKGADNVITKGITLGFEFQAVGQGRVVEIDKENGKIRVITDAGFPQDLGGSNTALYYADVFFGYHAGDFNPYYDLQYERFLSREADGSLWFRFDISKSWVSAGFEMIRVGDVLTTRIANQNAPTVGTYNAAGVFYEDITNYAHSGNVGFGENETDAVTYNRVIDTSAAAKRIDEETYERYKGYESLYGISFDISRDENGYRGAPARTGSVDGIHAINTIRGSQVTSSVFENIADDGTNQHGTYSRLSHIEDNGNGTATVYFKGNLTGVASAKINDPNAAITPNSWGRFPDEGDPVLLYSLGTGQIICEGTALSDTLSDGTRTTFWNTEVRCYQFTVAADTVDWETYATFVDRGVMDSQSDRLSVYDVPDPEYKIGIENRKYAAEGGSFDNCVVANTRSRGFVIQASHVRIQNCTFRNTQTNAIAVRCAHAWGETSFARDVEIKNCLMDHNGYRGETYEYAVIQLTGLGAETKLTLPLDDLRSGDILIAGNVMKNREAPHAISMRGVENVTIRNNDFGRKNDIEGLKKKKQSLYVDQCKNITVEGNIFSDPTISNILTVEAKRYIGLGGADLGDAFPDSPNA